MTTRHFFLSHLWLMLLCTCLCSISAETAPNDSLDHISDKEDSFNTFPFVGCVPCSQKYLLSSFTEGNQILRNKEIKALLAQEFGSHNQCKMVSLRSKSDMPQLSTMSRNLDGDGSHRRVMSSMTIGIPFDGKMKLDAYDCNIVLIESLPVGVFADSFELLRLVSKKVFRDAAIFGDTNLELPSALSNRSTVELHLNHGSRRLLEAQVNLISSEMPLHVRYSPLDASGYSIVEIESPNVVMRCEPKNVDLDCFSLIYIWNVRSEENLVWRVPCGNQDVSALVSTVTFIAALISALILVFVSLIHVFSGNHVKQS